MPREVLHILSLAINVLIWIIIIEAAVSMAISFGMKVSPYHPVVKFLRAIVNPICNPIRRLLPPPYKTGGWDFSPLIVILALRLIQQFLLG